MPSHYLDNKKFEEVILRYQQSLRDMERHNFELEDYQETTERLGKKNIKPVYWDYHEGITIKIKNNFSQAQMELAEQFRTLSEHIVRYAKWAVQFNFTDQDDAIQEGVMICFEKINRFNPKKGKAFNYMTTCILNHLRQLYRTSKNYKLFTERYSNFLQDKQKVIISNGKKKIVN